MSEDCPFCPQITIAVKKFNMDHPHNGIKVVDVYSPWFSMYENMLYEIQKRTGEGFATPTVIFGNCYIVGAFDWRGVLAFLNKLDEEENYENS